MPAPRAGDFYLNNLPYVLSRQQKIDKYGEVSQGPQSWNRTGHEDSPIRRSNDDLMWGNLADDLDHAEVWSDWTAGFGSFYRTADNPNAYSYAQNFDTRFPGQLIHAQQMNLAGSATNVDVLMDVPLAQGSGAPVAPAGAGMVLAVGNPNIQSFTPKSTYNVTSTAFDVNIELTGLPFGHRPALFGSYTYIPNLAGSGWYRRSNDGLTYTAYAGSGFPVRWFCVAAGVMWWEQGGGTLRDIALVNNGSPEISGGIAATLNIGLGAQTSQDAVALNDQLYVGFPDGLYQGNTAATFVNVTNNLGVGINRDNVRDLTVRDGAVVFQEGAHVFSFQPSTGANTITREIGTVGTTSNRSPVRGRFTCVENFGKYLFAGLFTGSQSWIMAGIEASGTSWPFVWHPMQLLPTVSKISRIHIDAVSQTSGGAYVPNRLWVATEGTFGANAGATAPLYQFPIPQGYDNPLADMTFSATYCGSARIDLGQTNWQAPGTPKVFRNVEIWSEGTSVVSGAQYGNLYYTVDNGNRNLLGYVGTGPKCVLPFDDVFYVTGQAIQLSLESFTSSLGITPIWRSIVLRGTSAPTAVDEITATIRVADDMKGADHSPLRSAATMMAELRGFAGQAMPITLTDLTGATWPVKVQNNIIEQETYQQGRDNPEMNVTIKMTVMTFTAAPSPAVGTNAVAAKYTNDQVATLTNNQLQLTQ